jgi:cell division protein FtsI (penicillin-binding protein 3)
MEQCARMDDATLSSGATDDALASRSAPDRVAALGSLVVMATLVLFGVMLARVVQLQTSPSEKLRPFISERTTTIKQRSVHGAILDRRGTSLAETRFGRRVFIDPVEFAESKKTPPDAIPRLAEAMGVEPSMIARRLAGVIERNQRIAGAASDESPETLPDLTPQRYVSIGGVLEDWREDAVKALKIPGVALERREVRVLAGGPEVAGLVGLVGVDHDGLAGAEKLADPLVNPATGSYTYVRDGYGNPLWVSPGAYKPAQRGSDVRVSLDLQIQSIATEELTRGVEEADAAGGRCVVMDPRTGEVLAMVDLIREPKGLVDYDWVRVIPKGPTGGSNIASSTRYRTIRRDELRERDPQTARNRCIEDVYEPGSTFKSFMWAATTDLGLARPSEFFNTHWGQYRTPYGRLVSDVKDLPQQSWSDVLINSSNIGMSQGVVRMTLGQTHDAVARFGFGKRTGIGLPGESGGVVVPLNPITKPDPKNPKRKITLRDGMSRWDQTSIAMGHAVAVTPLQMVRAFSVFARDGELAGTLPPVNLFAVDPELSMIGVEGPRVVSQHTAELTRKTMRGVTHNLDMRLSRKDPDAASYRYEAFGKSGTAEIPQGDPPEGKKRPRGSDGYFRGQYNASFIAGAPAESPRVVVLVVIDDPGPELIRTKQHYGSATAGPVNRRIIERSLTYLGVKPSYAPGELQQLMADAEAAEAGRPPRERPEVRRRYASLDE